MLMGFDQVPGQREELQDAGLQIGLQAAKDTTFGASYPGNFSEPGEIPVHCFENLLDLPDFLLHICDKKPAQI